LFYERSLALTLERPADADIRDADIAKALAPRRANEARARATQIRLTRMLRTAS